MTVQPLAGARLPKQRYLVKFESRDGAEALLFPRIDHEWDEQQALNLAGVSIIGASYGVDLLGHAVAPKGAAIERVRYVVTGTPAQVDVEIDDQRYKLQSFGIGKLWSRDATENGNFRWAWARASAMPDISTGTKDNNVQPVSVTFTRYSDWFAADATVDVETVDASPHTVTLTNSGNAQIDAITVELAGTFTNPKLTNLTTGEWVQLTRSGAGASDVLRLIANEFRAEYSADSGATWLSAYPDLVMGPTQVGFLRLIRGTNTLQLVDDATPDATLTLTFYQTYQ